MEILKKKFRTFGNRTEVNFSAVVCTVKRKVEKCRVVLLSTQKHVTSCRLRFILETLRETLLPWSVTLQGLDIGYFFNVCFFIITIRSHLGSNQPLIHSIKMAGAYRYVLYFLTPFKMAKGKAEPVLFLFN
jgi:hypothetical protein